MIVAIGLELSTEVDMAAGAVAGPEQGKWRVRLALYGSPEAAVAEAGRLYMETENAGVYLDPVACAGVLDALRSAGLWLHELNGEDVSAAAWQFITELRAKRVKLDSHPALRDSMRHALPRPLAQRFAYERRKVISDMSPLNACAFSLLGLRRHEAVSDPGVWVI